MKPILPLSQHNTAEPQAAKIFPGKLRDLLLRFSDGSTPKAHPLSGVSSRKKPPCNSLASAHLSENRFEHSRQLNCTGLQWGVRMLQSVRFRRIFSRMVASGQGIYLYGPAFFAGPQKDTYLTSCTISLSSVILPSSCTSTEDRLT